jgi:hypothetical protein
LVCRVKRFTAQNENEMDALQGARKRRTGAATAYVEAQQAAGRVAFSMADLMRETGLSMTAAKGQLRRLGTDVVRVSPSQQFFLIVSPENRARGGPPAEWWLDDYFRWLGQPYYLALLSAASAHGSNPQALQVTQVMTDKPLRPINIGRMRLRFFVKGGMERTPTQQPEGGVAPLLISTPEATTYDLIRYATSIGGIERAAETIRPLLPLLRPGELKHALDTGNESAVAQRMGFILDACGSKSLAKVVRDWLPGEIQPVMLASERGKHGNFPLIQRWQVLNNSSELNL